MDGDAAGDAAERVLGVELLVMVLGSITKVAKGGVERVETDEL